MASAWGDSWGSAWGDAWGSIAAAVQNAMASGNRRERKKRAKVIRFSDFETQEKRAAAIALAAMPMAQVSDTGHARKRQFEDDEAIINALLMVTLIE